LVKKSKKKKRATFLKNRLDKKNSFFSENLARVQLNIVFLIARKFHDSLIISALVGEGEGAMGRPMS